MVMYRAIYMCNVVSGVANEETTWSRLSDFFFLFFFCFLLRKMYIPQTEWTEDQTTKTYLDNTLQFVFFLSSHSQSVHSRGGGELMHVWGIAMPVFVICHCASLFVMLHLCHSMYRDVCGCVQVMSDVSLEVCYLMFCTMVLWVSGRMLFLLTATLIWWSISLKVFRKRLFSGLHL